MQRSRSGGKSRFAGKFGPAATLSQNPIFETAYKKIYCAKKVYLIPISVLKNARFWTAVRVLSLKVVPWEDKSEGQTKRKE